MKCRCCDQPMRRLSQGCHPKRVNGVIVFTDVMVLVDCQNPACKMYQQTINLENYPTLDLSKYGVES